MVSGKKMIPRIGQMIGPNARSTQGVKIHISATARRGDKSAMSTKMQPNGASSSRFSGRRSATLAQSKEVGKPKSAVAQLKGSASANGVNRVESRSI
jgi:hypothetical protein